MHTRNLFTIICLLLFCKFSNGQEIQLDKKNKVEVIIYETSQKGQLIDSIGSFGILKNPQFDLETLIPSKVYIFKRVDDGFEPKLHIWYHYDLKGKKPLGIKYNWGLYNPRFASTGNIEYLNLLTTKENEFNQKYQGLKKQLNEKYGIPIKTHTIANNSQCYIEEVFWEDKEKIIDLTIKFYRQLKRIPGVTDPIGDFEISVTATYK